MIKEAATLVLKESLKKMAVDRIMKELILSASFFAVPGVNRLTVIFLSWIIDFIIEKTELGLYFIYTDNIVEKQANELLKALQNQKDHPNEENEKDLIEKFNNFINLNPNKLRS